MSYFNPHALYIHCDAAMDYDSQNSGGVGVEIVFPDTINIESKEFSIGRFVGANIERLELKAIITGIEETLKLFSSHSNDLQNINTIIITTDRYGLNDKEKTSPYRIRGWKKNKWKNFEDKPIKNRDLLDQVDKLRRKLSSTAFSNVSIDYLRRNYNKAADKLAKKGKKFNLKDDSIAIKGAKPGRRKFDGPDIHYNLLKEKQEFVIHIFRKESVDDLWELSTEFCEGEFKGQKLKIIVDIPLEKKLHRHHFYRVRTQKIFSHHITIYKSIKEIKNI